ncbi:MAG TPA: DUF222 domain-containing protein [Mycobacteriales bacterium]|nr:DUF222 domain-containing protein [Mycobacteriales bacterium]
MREMARDASWAELAHDASDPFLQLCADPAFAAALDAAQAAWAADEPFVDAVRRAPDDDTSTPLVDVAAPTVREQLTDAAGADFARRMAILERLDPADLDGWESEEHARLWATLAAHIAYQQIGARLAVDARCRSPKQGGASFAGTSLAVAEKVSPGTAEVRLANARQAVERLPDLVALLGAGEISEAHLRKALEETRTLSRDDCLTVQARLATKAPHVAPGQLGQAARRAAAAIDPDDFTKRQTSAREHRCAYVRPGEDGMAFLGIDGPATQIALAHLSLEQAARALRAAGDPRTLDQLTCDLALERLQGMVVADGEPASADVAHVTSTRRTKHGRPVKVVVHVDLRTLLHGANTPGEVTGVGPIPAAIARELAGQSNDWWRMVLDPHSGVCRDYGRLKKPGQDLTDLIVARDATCRAPMCDKDIDDIDHATERHRGGLTTEANLEGLSAHCHTVKSDGGWQPTLHPDGTVTWTSPHGTEHTVRAKDHRLDIRNDLQRRPVYDIDTSTLPPGPDRDAIEQIQRELAERIAAIPDEAPY